MSPEGRRVALAHALAEVIPQREPLLRQDARTYWLPLLASHDRAVTAAERARCLAVVTGEIDGDSPRLDGVLSTIAYRIDPDSADGRWQAKLDGHAERRADAALPFAALQAGGGQTSPPVHGAKCAGPSWKGSACGYVCPCGYRWEATTRDAGDAARTTGEHRWPDFDEADVTPPGTAAPQHIHEADLHGEEHEP